MPKLKGIKAKTHTNLKVRCRGQPRTSLVHDTDPAIVLPLGNSWARGCKYSILFEIPITEMRTRTIENDIIGPWEHTEEKYHELSFRCGVKYNPVHNHRLDVIQPENFKNVLTIEYSFYLKSAITPFPNPRTNQHKKTFRHFSNCVALNNTISFTKVICKHESIEYEVDVVNPKDIQRILFIQTHHDDIIPHLINTRNIQNHQ
jgi:hypothetical protein